MQALIEVTVFKPRRGFAAKCLSGWREISPSPWKFGQPQRTKAPGLVLGSWLGVGNAARGRAGDTLLPVTSSARSGEWRELRAAAQPLNAIAR